MGSRLSKAQVLHISRLRLARFLAGLLIFLTMDLAFCHVIID